jgi:hypothetical protein
VQHLPTIIAGGFPVHFVAQDRVADRMEMDSNLVGSPRKNLAKNQSPPPGVLNDFELGVRRPAAVDHGHFLTLHWMATDRLDNFAGRLGKSASAQGQIKFLNFSSGKLVAQAQVRKVVLGNYEAATGVLVEPVDHARSKLTADSAQVRDLMQQGVNQRAGLHARSGVNRHPSRFVDDQ